MIGLPAPHTREFGLLTAPPLNLKHQHVSPASPSQAPPWSCPLLHPLKTCAVLASKGASRVQSAAVGRRREKRGRPACVGEGMSASKWAAKD